MSPLTANASVADSVHAIAGLLGLAPVMLVPGYLLNRATQVLGGRDASALDSIAASLALSMGVLPVLIHLIGRCTMISTRVFFWTCVALFFLLVWGKRTELRRLSAATLRIPAILALLWVLFAILSQIDWQWGNHVYTSSIVYDHALRIGLIGGIARANSLPPPDPFLRLGTAIPLAYHYFWFLLCSLPCREFPNWIGPRGAMMAGTVWTGLVLWAVLSLWLRMLRREREWTTLRWIVAALLLAVSGLDLLAFLVSVSHRLWIHDPHWIPYATLDWWSFDQVTNWIDVLLWVPHCAAALAACATGLLILLDCPHKTPKNRAISTMIAGACFASSVGLSIYVAFGFLVFCAAYAVFLAFRRNWTGIVALATAGAVMALLAVPFLLELKAHAPGQAFLHLGWRSPATMIGKILGHTGHAGRLILYAPSVVITLIFEFGFFAAALWYWWRRGLVHTSSGQGWTLVLLFCVPLVLTSIARSDAVDTNDLAMRGMFAAQFAIAVIAGDWLLNGTGEKRAYASFRDLLKKLPRPALVVLGLGLMTTLAEAALLRTFTLFQESGHVEGGFIASPDIGLTTQSTREAYGWLRQHSSPSAVVQNNPTADWDFLLGLYADRQSVVTGKAELRYKSTYSPQIRQVIEDLSPLFVPTGNSTSDPDSRCAKWGIDYLVVKSTDPVWHDPASWIWHKTPIYANRATRVYACSPQLSAFRSGSPASAGSQTQ